MFYCFEEKNILPSAFKAIPLNEKIILRAFMEKSLELRQKPPET